MVSTPQVSVIIPAYNISDYIESALLSVERQSLREFEAIVVDDGSSDDTALVVQKFMAQDSRFRLLQKPNGGLSSARNYGIRHSNADYIALLDGDDAYYPDKLANHVALLNQNSSVGVVYSASKIIRDSGRKTFISMSGKPVCTETVTALLCKNFVGHGSNAVFRRQIFDEVGGFDEGLRSNEDVDFWLKVAITRRWQFYREPRVLCYYRLRPSGLSYNVAQMQDSADKMIELAYYRSPELVEPAMSSINAYKYRFLARLCLQNGDVQKAWDFIHKAWTNDSSIFFRDASSLATLTLVGLSVLWNQTNR